MARTARASIATFAAQPVTAADRRSTRALRIFSALLFLALAGTSALMTGPLIHSDEGSYLLNAAAIAGKLHSSLGASYYSGYSLLIAPAFLLLPDFGSIFHYTLLLNAALLASTPFALRRVLQVVKPGIGASWQVLAAVAACCEVALLTNSQLALSENLLIPLYAWLLAFGGSMLLWRRGWHALVCGALAGSLFLVHPRGAAMALPVLFALSLPALRDRGLRTAVLSMWVCAALVAALHMPLEWLADKTADNAVQSYSLLAVLQKLRSPLAWAQAAFNAFGAFTYIAIATFGVIFFAWRDSVRAALGARFGSHDSAAPRDALMLAMLLGLVTSIAVTAMYMIPAERADQIIYGRYALPLMVPMLALGITGLRDAALDRPSASWCAVAATLACIVVMAAAFRVLPHPPTDTWVEVNIVDLYFPVALNGHIDWATIGFHFCVVAFAIHSAAAFSGRLAVVVFAAFNILAAGYVITHSTLPSNALRASERQGVAAVRDFERVTGTPLCISISFSVDNWHGLDYQNWLFDRVSESAVVDRERCVRGIIGSLIEKRPTYPSFRLISTDLYNPYGLFVQASPALDAYLAVRSVPPVDFPSPLPETSLHAEVALAGTTHELRATVGRPLVLHVHVRNAGSGIWPAAFDASRLKSVRVGARTQRLESTDIPVEFRADLDRSLQPGDTSTVALTVGPFDKPGRYTLMVGLLQEATAWFDGTDTATIEVSGR